MNIEQAHTKVYEALKLKIKTEGTLDIVNNYYKLTIDNKRYYFENDRPETSIVHTSSSTYISYNYCRVDEMKGETLRELSDFLETQILGIDSNISNEITLAFKDDVNVAPRTETSYIQKLRATWVAKVTEKHASRLRSKFPKQLASDRQFFIDASKAGHEALVNLGDNTFYSDMDLAKQLIANDPNELQAFSSEIRDSDDLVQFAIDNKISGNIFRHLSPRLQAQKNVALRFMTSDTYLNLSDELKRDRDIIMKALELGVAIELKSIGSIYLNDEDVVIALAKSDANNTLRDAFNSLNFKSISQAIRKNRLFNTYLARTDNHGKVDQSYYYDKHFILAIPELTFRHFRNGNRQWDIGTCISPHMTIDADVRAKIINDMEPDDAWSVIDTSLQTLELATQLIAKATTINQIEKILEHSETEIIQNNNFMLTAMQKIKLLREDYRLFMMSDWAIGKLRNEIAPSGIKGDVSLDDLIQHLERKVFREKLETELPQKQKVKYAKI